LYTSPHLVRINERIRINGREIGDDHFAAVYERVAATVQELVAAGKLPWHPSFFEMLTAMAFLTFADAPVEIAVLEVGMGGRLDATNVVEPLLSIITDIALDHQEFLGQTLREIAFEKAGIIRPGGIVVTLPQHPEASEAIGKVVLELGTRAVSAVRYVPPVSPGVGNSDLARIRTCYPMEVMGEQIQVDSPLFGRHQWRNLALAIAAAEQLNCAGFAISPRDIQEGIRRTPWPGRFQVVPPDSKRKLPEVVLDVAHNPAGAWALRSALSERYLNQSSAEEPTPRAEKPVAGNGKRPLVFLFGAMRDKAIAEVASILFPLAQHVVVTRAESPRAATPEEVRSVSQRAFGDIALSTSVPEGLELACALASQNGVVVVTGSIYVVGEVMKALGTQPAAVSPQPV
jgi:dihydrofolate synthase/folylpolyglutamate synthase